MLKRIIILISLCGFLPLPAQAVIVSGLYEAEVPVPDQSPESHKKGLSSAMLNVLVKLTGDRNVQGRQATAFLLTQPENYVQQYKYRNKSAFEGGQLSLDQQLYLWVSFNAEALDRVLRDYSVPLWGKVRPASLVWLVVEESQGRKFIGLEDEAGFTASLANYAQARGIALVHPVLDSEDTSVLKEADVWGGFMEPVKQASARYTPDAILTGSIKQIAVDSWEGQWTAILGDEVTSWSIKGDKADVVLQEGIDQLADILASRYVQVATQTQGEGIEIIVKDINDFEQYSKVLKYLMTLNTVTSVDVKTVEPGSVTFSVAATGGDLVIQRAIELGRILESMTGTGSPYRLLP